MDIIFTRKFSEVFEKELEHISSDGKNLYGLALSGGGIRSASFSLGVMQALVAKNILKKIDYLSTVSGGGYIGSSLTWFLSKKLPDGTTNAGTDVNHFPLGSKQVGSRSCDNNKRNALLDYIRQHGNYLVPGYGIDGISLAAVILRAMIVSLIVYFSLSVVIMGFFLELGLFKEFNYLQPHGIIISSCTSQICLFNFFTIFAILLIFLFGFASIAYSIFTTISFVGKNSRYYTRTKYQIWFGWILAISFSLFLIGILPSLYLITGNLVYGGFTAGSSTIIGTIIGFLHHQKEKSLNNKNENNKSLIPLLGAGFLIFGIIFGSFVAAKTLNMIFIPWYWISTIFFLALFIGFFTNTNYFGIHRMYRDRLMETFLPNNFNIKNNQWGLATDADEVLIENLCNEPNKRPYHLINTNIVLVDSPESKYRGRSGDSFILSPLYCGSDATGWKYSKLYMKKFGQKGMSLATAMAISGAAANPNSGVGGKGPTVNRLVSTLMSLLNLRLGYWAPNPNPKLEWFFSPNFIFPGLRGGVLTGGLTEKRALIELSDGGHFENLGIYELIRREVRVIIVCDGGADPKFSFDDLSNATERVRVDFGVKISFDNPNFSLNWLLPGSDNQADKNLIDKYDLAKHGFAIGEIRYPIKEKNKEYKKGILIYLKTAMISGLSPDIYGYKSNNPSFPDQPTSDQFFDETQFEAYRELGYHIGWQMLENIDFEKMHSERAVENYLFKLNFNA